LLSLAHPRAHFAADATWARSFLLFFAPSLRLLGLAAAREALLLRRRSIRAAAAHALVWQRDHEKASLVMESLGRFTPPLVTVAATLSTMQGTCIAGYEDALRFLSKDDRAVARRMIDERPKNLRIAAQPPEAAEREAEPDGAAELNRGVNRA